MAHPDRHQQARETDSARAERYRVAAEDALEQLDWTIGYLHGIRKTEVSRALANNRLYIRRSLMREPGVTDPTAETAER
jgi:hypothetical protein